MHVTFITNQHKTAFYLAIASSLKTRVPSARVSWLSTGRRWSDLLRQGNVSDHDILELHKDGYAWTEKPTFTNDSMLKMLEADLSVPINDMIIMDRALNKWDGSLSRAYMAVVGARIEAFLREQSPDILLGETTWAVELLAIQLAEKHGAAAGSLGTLRIPADRMVIFRGPYQRDIYRLANPVETAADITQEALVSLRERNLQPYYLSMNNNPTRLRPHWFGEALAAGKNLLRGEAWSNDPSVPALAHRICNRAARSWRNFKDVPRAGFERAPKVSSNPFILFTLHVQPESSVDVFAAPYNDQLAAIRALSRKMPADWELWVKEHSNAIGNRGRDYYQALRKIPGVRLIDPGESALALVRRAAAVISPSGTVSFEASMLKRPAATLAPMYFTPVLALGTLDVYNLNTGEIEERCAEAETYVSSDSAEMERRRFLCDIIAHSRPAIIGDPINVPRCMEHDNICVVAEAIEDLYHQKRTLRGDLRKSEKLLCLPLVN